MYVAQWSMGPPGNVFPVYTSIVTTDLIPNASVTKVAFEPHKWFPWSNSGFFGGTTA